MTDKTVIVIFDLDGTLVDSQPATLGSTMEALSRYGIEAAEPELREVFGGGAEKLLGHFLERDLGVSQAEKVVRAAVDLRRDLQLELVDRTTLLPGVKDLMATLKDAGYRLAVATMSSREVTEKTLEFHDIRLYLSVVLTIDDVAKGKPDPEILIKALDLLGGQTKNTLYVGDSSHDLEAALALGMRFLLVDSDLYVRGEARKKLQAAAAQNGFPIVGLENLFKIAQVAQGQT